MAKIAGLDDVVGEIDKGGKPKVSVRTLLSWFDAERRGARVLESIGRELETRRLVTNPSYAQAHIDESIEFSRLAPSIPPGAQPSATPPPVTSGAAEAPLHAQRVRSVRSATAVPAESVCPDMPIGKALSLMVARDLTTLPVLTGTHTIKGVLTWASYGTQVAVGRTPTIVQEAMTQARTVSLDGDLFRVVAEVREHGCVLVVQNNKLTGSITASDLADHLAELAEPFALVGEIEGHLRTLRRRTTGSDGGEEATLGDQHAWFAEQWATVGLTFDRDTFLGDLDAVRELRNDIAHFSPDPLETGDLRRLRDFARLLAKLAA